MKPGRTTTMLQAVAKHQRENPDVRVMVIAHSQQFVKSYLKPLAVECGVDVSRVQWETPRSGADRIRGQRPAVFWDHAVYLHRTPNDFSDIRDIEARAWVAPTKEQP